MPVNNMCELTDFIKTNPRTGKIREFTISELEVLNEYDMPEEIRDFLKREGLSEYRDHFFCTVLPQWYSETLSEWGFNGKQCFAFMKTALGGLFFYHKGKIYRLNPLTGNAVKSDFDFCMFMDILLTMDSILEACYVDIFEKYRTAAVPAYDEIYALVPALPIGGSFETSRYEIVKMHEHLGFLAQLFDNKAKKM
jgi:hypothetical protein